MFFSRIRETYENESGKTKETISSKYVDSGNDDKDPVVEQVLH